MNRSLASEFLQELLASMAGAGLPPPVTGAAGPGRRRRRLGFVPKGGDDGDNDEGDDTGEGFGEVADEETDEEAGRVDEEDEGVDYEGEEA